MKFIFNTNDGIEIHFQLPVEGLSANGENQPVIGVTIRGDGGKGAAANTGKELPELCLAHTIPQNSHFGTTRLFAQRIEFAHIVFSKTSHVPQWIADLRGRKMLDANDAALKFWRMTREQFLSSRFDEFFHPEEMTRWENFISLNRWGESGPWKCTHGDRTIFYCTVRWQMIDYDGKPCAVVMAVRAGDSIATMADLNSDQSQSAGAVAE